MNNYLYKRNTFFPTAVSWDFFGNSRHTCRRSVKGPGWKVSRVPRCNRRGDTLGLGAHFVEQHSLQSHSVLSHVSAHTESASERQKSQSPDLKSFAMTWTQVSQSIQRVQGPDQVPQDLTENAGFLHHAEEHRICKKTIRCSPSHQRLQNHPPRCTLPSAQQTQRRTDGGLKPAFHTPAFTDHSYKLCLCMKYGRKLLLGVWTCCVSTFGNLPTLSGATTYLQGN